MNNLVLSPTPKTPAINFNSTTGILFLKGKSIPENTFKFYQELTDWLNDYSISPAAESHFNIYLEYFNTSSAKRILDCLKILQRIGDEGKTKVQINWTYEENDTDMLEAGEDFRDMLHIPFNISSVQEED
jgi:hypothetical protein